MLFAAVRVMQSRSSLLLCQFLFAQQHSARQRSGWQPAPCCLSETVTQIRSLACWEECSYTETTKVEQQWDAEQHWPLCQDHYRASWLLRKITVGSVSHIKTKPNFQGWPVRLFHQVCTYDRMGLGFSKRLMQNETTGTEKVWGASTTGRWVRCNQLPVVL